MFNANTQSGLSLVFVVGEFVPIKHRFAAVGFLFMLTLPVTGFGAAVGTALYTILRHSGDGVFTH
jgi:hypothetical protein